MPDIQHINKKHKYREEDVFTAFLEDHEPVAIFAESVNQARQVATEHFKIKKRNKDKLEVIYGYPNPSERTG